MALEGNVTHLPFMPGPENGDSFPF